MLGKDIVDCGDAFIALETTRAVEPEKQRGGGLRMRFSDRSSRL
jgi:hypothetical protein